MDKHQFLDDLDEWLAQYLETHTTLVARERRWLTAQIVEKAETHWWSILHARKVDPEVTP